MSARIGTFLIIKKEEGENSYSLTKDTKNISGYTDKMNFSEVRRFMAATTIRFNGLKFADFDYDSERDLDIIGILEYKFAQSRLGGRDEGNYFILTSIEGDDQPIIEQSAQDGRMAEEKRGNITEDVFYTKQNFNKAEMDAISKIYMKKETWKD